MGINRFDKPAKQPLLDTTVSMPNPNLDLSGLFKYGETIEPKITAAKSLDIDPVASIRQHDTRALELQEQTNQRFLDLLDDPNVDPLSTDFQVAKNKIVRDHINNPDLRKIQRSISNWEAYQKDKSKMGADYRWYNDPNLGFTGTDDQGNLVEFAPQALAAYSDHAAPALELFNVTKASASKRGEWSDVMDSEGKFTKVTKGGKGRTQEFMNYLAENNLGAYLESAGGQDFVRQRRAEGATNDEIEESALTYLKGLAANYVYKETSYDEDLKFAPGAKTGAGIGDPAASPAGPSSLTTGPIVTGDYDDVLKGLEAPDWVKYGYILSDLPNYAMMTEEKKAEQLEKLAGKDITPWSLLEVKKEDQKTAKYPGMKYAFKSLGVTEDQYKDMNAVERQQFRTRLKKEYSDIIKTYNQRQFNLAGVGDAENQAMNAKFIGTQMENLQFTEIKGEGNKKGETISGEVLMKNLRDSGKIGTGEESIYKTDKDFREKGIIWQGITSPSLGGEGDIVVIDGKRYFVINPGTTEGGRGTTNEARQASTNLVELNEVFRNPELERSKPVQLVSTDGTGSSVFINGEPLVVNTHLVDVGRGPDGNIKRNIELEFKYGGKTLNIKKDLPEDKQRELYEKFGINPNNPNDADSYLQNNAFYLEGNARVTGTKSKQRSNLNLSVPE